MKAIPQNTISWRLAVFVTSTIIMLAAFKRLAVPLYATAPGRFPAKIIEIMGSRSILFDWSPAGYYEDLFAGNRPDKRQIWFRTSTFIPDDFRIRRLRPNLRNVTDWQAEDTPVNRFGYIGPDWSISKPANIRRVAVLGDSVPEGFGVNMNQGFIHLLENRLNQAMTSRQSSERFEFLNFSVSGYHLTQMMDVALNDTQQFQPDAYMAVLTELSVYRGWDTHWVYLAQSGVDPKYEFLREAQSRANAQKSDDEAVLSAKFAPFRTSIISQTIAGMQKYAEAHGAQFVVVLLPAVEDVDIAKRRFIGMPELLSSMKVTFVDLSDTFTPLLDRESIRLSRTDVHPNPLGHRIICDSLYAKLRANADAWSKLVSR